MESLKEQALSPQDEKPAFVCPGCGGLLLSGETVRQEGLFGEVVGCEKCSEWEQSEALASTPQCCPNCGEAPGADDSLLLGEHGMVIACGCCTSDAVAALVCERLPLDESGIAEGTVYCA